jgi:hypothetical protein
MYEVRDDLRTYDLKTHIILEIKKSYLRQYLYMAVIQAPDSSKFIIPFGSRYVHIYSDRTGLNDDNGMICPLDDLKNKFINDNSKYITTLNKRYLEYRYLYS